MKDLDLFSLRLFVAVCDAKSILKVAQAENVAPSGVSKRLDKLEAIAEVPLLKRVKQGVEATPAGLTFAEMARGVLLASSDLREQMSGIKSGEMGTVHLAATPNIMAGQLIQDLADFLALADNRRINVNMTECAEPRSIMQGIRDGLYSLGLIWDRIDTAGVQSIPYFTTTIVAIVHKKHPLAQHASVTLTECIEFDIIASQGTRLIEALLRRQGFLKGQLLHYRAQAWSAEACMRLIAGGLGVGFLPADVAGVQLDNLNLVAVPMSDPWSVRNIRICFKDEAMLSPASRLLVNHLTSRAAGANPAWPRPL